MSGDAQWQAGRDFSIIDVILQSCTGGPERHESNLPRHDGDMMTRGHIAWHDASALLIAAWIYQIQSRYGQSAAESDIPWTAELAPIWPVESSVIRTSRVCLPRNWVPGHGHARTEFDNAPAEWCDMYDICTTVVSHFTSRLCLRRSGHVYLNRLIATRRTVAFLCAYV